MWAVKGDNGVGIASDFVTAFYLATGQRICKAYNVEARLRTGEKYKATVAAENGDAAIKILAAALAKEGIRDVVVWRFQHI